MAGINEGRVSSSNAAINSLVGASEKSIDPARAAQELAQQVMDSFNRLGKKATIDLIKFQEVEEAKLRKKQTEEDKKRIKEAKKDMQSEFGKVVSQIGENFKKAISQGLTKASASIDKYIDTYTRYMGSINTRLQNTGLSFDKIANNIARNLGTSPYLRQEDMLTNLNKFVEQGIAYNLESRAYIATATAKIANTFNAFDSSLLRIIRIQQADSTVARLGMESLLTKFLNVRYQDTSYLNTSSNITANLLEAESLMGYKGASEFELAVQSYLGSMSALGVSDAAINLISQGLGYLGSGNYSALLGNEGLRNLFGMAASRAGTDIGSLLTGGLTASSASALLSNIIGIGQGIAGSGNNVTRSAFANLFGLSVSDIVSLTNITANDLKAITDNIVSYESMRNETANQLRTMSERTTTSEKIQNVISNMMLGLGANVATNPALYGIWEAANILSGSGLDYTIGGGFIPAQTSLSQIMKTGVIGISGIMSIANALGNLDNLGGTSLSVWGEKETRGGGGLGAYASGKTLSGTSYIGSLDSSSISSALGDIESQAKTYLGEEVQSDIDKIIREDISPNVASILNVLQTWDNKLTGSNLARLLGTY